MSGGSVLVAGSINMDLVARAPELPLPGETLLGTRYDTFPGGKGSNQAIAAQRAGARTQLVGCIGSDDFGRSMRSYLQTQGVALQMTTSATSTTGTALIIVSDSGENSIVVIPGANASVDVSAVPQTVFHEADVGVAQLEIPPSVVAEFLRRCRSANTTTILNAAPATGAGRQCLALADILVVNETELATFSGVPVTASSSDDELLDACRALRTGVEQTVVLTLGERGVLAVTGDAAIRLDGHSVPVVDTTGAGDCFVGWLAAGISKGDSMADALAQANLAASLCVQKSGAAPSLPSAEDVNV